MSLRGRLLRAWLFGLLLLAGGCATVGVLIPPINHAPTGSQIPGKFVWRDLFTDDVRSCRKFYTDLFGWEFDPPMYDSLYATIRHRGVPIGAMVYTRRLEAAQPVSQWISYLSVPDVDAAALEITRSNGRVVRGPLDISRRGRIAIVIDPQGAPLGLICSSSGDPVDRKPDAGEWLWTELFASDPPAAVSWYARFTGSTYDSTTLTGQQQYYYLKRDGKARGGVLGIQWKNVRPNWLPYILVDDPAASVEKARMLGATVILEPRMDVRNGSVGVIADPSGAAVALQKWPME